MKATPPSVRLRSTNWPDLRAVSWLPTQGEQREIVQWVFRTTYFTKVGIAGEFDAEGQAIPMTIPVKNPRQKKSENSDVGHQPCPWGYPTRIQLTVVQKYVHLELVIC